MSPERAERIREWHERAYVAAQEEGADEQTFDYLGRTIVVPPGVQPITGMSDLFGNIVLAEVRAGDRVLDMGTGSGVNAILAAERAAYVLAVDVNPVAVEAARANAAHNGVEKVVEVRESDVFSAVDGSFDLVTFDPPFRWYAPRDALEMASTDTDYRVLRTFVAQVRDHLSPGGRILLFFGSSGDLDYLDELLGANGFSTEIVADRTLERDGFSVAYRTMRVTPEDEANIP